MLDYLKLKKYIPYFLVVVILIFGGFVINWFETIAAPTNGLVGYWNFDEGSGTTAADSSGNGNNGVLTNGPTWSAGKIGGALSFDGSNDNISIPHKAIINPGIGLWSMGAWVKTNSDGTIISKMSASISGADHYILKIVGGLAVADFSNDLVSDNFTATSTTNVADGRWHHIVGEKTAQFTAKIFVDGVLENTNTRATSGSSLDSTSPLLIGKDYRDTSFFPGLIDEVRIYNRALMAQEIQSLYTEGGGTPPIADTQTPTVPQNLTTAAVSASQINLSWSAASDNIGVTGYKIYRNNSLLTTQNSLLTTYSDTGLSPQTTYSYTIAAFDAAGNISLQSTMVTAQTLASISPAPTPTPIPPPAVSISQSNWVPPIGIPVPPFGISEVASPRPNPWVTEVPGYYYIDRTHPAATNINNPWGTPAKPRQWFPLVLPAGSVVEIHGDFYLGIDPKTGQPLGYRSPSIITANGTATAPVFIRGVSPTDKPRIMSTWQVRGTYLIMENLEFADFDGDLTGGEAGKLQITSPANSIVLRFSDLHGNLGGYGNILLGSADTNVVTNVVIYKNLIHDAGDVNATYDQDTHCIAVGSQVSNLWVVDNEMARCSGDGIQVAGGLSTHHIYVGRNVAHHNKQSGFWSKVAADVIFSQNTAHDHRPSNSSPGQCMGFQYGPERVWFLYNHVYDCTYGIEAGSNSGGPGQDHYLIGNVIHDIKGGNAPQSAWDQAGIMLAGGVNRYLINNMIWNSNGGIYVPGGGKVIAANNIIGSLTRPESYHVFIEIPGVFSASTLQHNLFGGEFKVRASNTTYKSLETFQSSTGKGQRSLNADPQFLNPAANDFHLQATSPARDAGMVSSVYHTFKELYGIDIAKDFDSGVRPAGAGWDIGAYEYGSVPGPTQAPTQVSSQTPIPAPTPAPSSTPAPASIPAPLTQIPSPSTSASTPVSTPTTQAPTPSPAPTSSSGGGGGGGSSGSAPLTSGSGSYAPPVQSSPSSQTALGSVSSPTVKISTPLYLGLRHPEVEILQDLLIKQGFLTIQSPTGYFGILTQSAVGRFQEKYNIVSAGGSGYGRVGPITLAKINEVSNLSVTPSSEAERQALIQKLQLQIKILQLQLQILLLQQKLGR